MQSSFCRLFVKAVIYADLDALNSARAGTAGGNAPEIFNLLVSLP